MKKLWTLSLLLLVGAVVFVGCGEQPVDQNIVDENIVDENVVDENVVDEPVEDIEDITDLTATDDETADLTATDDTTVTE